jgi:hypothetical protein
LELTIVLTVVQHEPASDDPRSAAEPLLPARVAQDGDGMRAGLPIVLHRQQLSSGWGDPEPVERVTGEGERCDLRQVVQERHCRRRP